MDKLEVYNWVRGKILFDHKRYLEYDSIFKLSQIKTCKLFDFFKSVNEGVSVDKKFS